MIINTGIKQNKILIKDEKYGSLQINKVWRRKSFDVQTKKKKKKKTKKTKTNELKFEEALPVEDASGSKLLRT